MDDDGGDTAPWPATTPRPSTVDTDTTAATVSTVVRLRVTLLMTPSSGFRAALWPDESPVAEAYHHRVRGSREFGAGAVFSVVAPCQPGASPLSVRRRTCTTDC